MLIRKVHIENYRQYEGRQTIDFSCDPQKNFTVIKGTTGTGKSCIYNMFHWVLYDDDMVPKSSQNDDIEPLLSSNIFKQLDFHAIGKVGVKIEFGNKDETTVIIERNIQVKKLDRTNHKNQNKKQKIFIHHEGSGMKPLESKSEKTAYINRHFPPEISQLFFFDGEKLDQFFDPRRKRGEKIEHFIKLASGIDIIERIIAHLKMVDRELDKDDSFDNRHLIQVRVQLKNDIEEKKKKVGLRDDVNEKIVTLDQSIQEAENKRTLIDSIETQTKRLSELKDLCKTEEDFIKDKKKEYFDALVLIGPTYLFKKELKSFKDRVDVLEKENKIPPPLDPDYIKELLKEGKCICGRHIDDESKIMLKKLVETKAYYEHSTIYTDGRTHVNYMLKDIDSFQDNIKEINKELTRHEKKLEDYLKERSNIESTLDGIDIDELTVIQQQLTKDKKDKEGLIEERGSFKQEILTLEGMIRDGETKQNKLLRKESSSQLSAKKALLIKDALEKLKEYKDESFTKIKENIQKIADQLFRKMIWKKDVFAMLIIDENFKFKVMKTDGMDAFGTLSAGERQILAFAFIAAISKVAQIDNPLLIDTPFGRIDDDPTENIAEALKDNLSQFQITFLMTGKEFNENVKETMRPRIGKYYELQFNEDNATTKIKEMPL